MADFAVIGKWRRTSPVYRFLADAQYRIGHDEQPGFFVFSALCPCCCAVCALFVCVCCGFSFFVFRFKVFSLMLMHHLHVKTPGYPWIYACAYWHISKHEGHLVFRSRIMES